MTIIFNLLLTFANCLSSIIMFPKASIAFLLLTGSSLAINPEFNNEAIDGTNIADPISIVDNGWSLTVDHKITGLGNTETVQFFMEASGVGDGLCVNRKRFAPPGQNPIFTGTGDLLATSEDVKNGGIELTLSTSAPENDSNCCLFGEGNCEAGDLCPDECTTCKVVEDLEDCPNGKNWNQYTIGISYTSIVVDAEVTKSGDTEISWVQRLVCDFIATEDGADVAELVCEQCTLCDDKGNDCTGFDSPLSDRCPEA